MRFCATLLLSMAIVICYSIKGQTLRRPVAAPYTGFGAYSLHHVDVFSFTANQASLARLPDHAAGVYAERRFLLRELNSYTAVVGFNSPSGNVGLKAYYSGFTNYNETQLGLAYGRKLGSKVDIGAQFNYNGIRITGYGNAAAISFELGTVLHISDKLHAGVHVNNPVGGKFGKDQGEKLPAVFASGFGFDASEKFSVSFEVEKEEDQPVNVNAGFQYRFISRLMARAGMSSATTLAWLGFGLVIRTMRLDITTSYHPELGFTPGLLLIFQFKRSGE